MRTLLLLFASLMLVIAAWGGAAQAANFACDDAPAGVAMHIPGDCDQVPADADKGYPHCHTGCHGQSVTTPVPLRVAAQIMRASRAYDAPAEMAVAAHHADRTLRPPIA